MPGLRPCCCPPELWTYSYRGPDTSNVWSDGTTEASYQMGLGGNDWKTLRVRDGYVIATGTGGCRKMSRAATPVEQWKYQASTDYTLGIEARAELDSANDVLWTGTFGWGGSDRWQVLKLDYAAGTRTWRSRVYATTSTQRLHDCAVDSSDNVFVTGEVETGTGDAIWKLNSAGTEQWSYAPPGMDTAAEGRACRATPDDGVVVGFDLSGMTTTGDDSVWKLNSSGGRVWKVWSALPTVSLTDQENTQAWSLDVDADGNVYVMQAAPVWGSTLYKLAAADGSTVWSQTFAYSPDGNQVKVKASRGALYHTKWTVGDNNLVARRLSDGTVIEDNSLANANFPVDLTLAV
jgi:outer membrane protein assembly factor BamB